MISLRSRLAQAVILALAVLALYFPVLKRLALQWWRDENYSHGFLVPLVSLFLIWQRREELKGLNPQPSLWGLPVIFGALFILLGGQVTAELFTTRVSLIILSAGIILYLLGKEFLKNLAFPLSFLILMVPLPAIIFNQIAFPLQLVAANFATFNLQAIGVPVFREGNIINLANATLEVTEACSGIRSLMSLTALSLIFAYFSQHSLWKRAVLTISAVPIAIFSNAMRVAGTGALAHFVGAETAMGFYHTFSGWLVFVVAFGLLLLEGYIISTLFRERRPAMLLSEATE